MEPLSLCRGFPADQVGTVLLFSVISLIIWRVTFLRWMSYPFRLFNTFTHELSHGIAALATGGSFRRFSVNPDLTGVAWLSGGSRAIILSAGYVGSAVAGGLLLIIASRSERPGAVLFGLGVLLGLLCVIFVGNLFGVLTGFGFSGFFMWGAYFVPGEWHHLILLFLAVQMMFNAMNSLYHLWIVSTYIPLRRGDAYDMQLLTYIPAPVWAILWSLCALVILGISLGIAYCPDMLPLLRTWKGM